MLIISLTICLCSSFSMLVPVKSIDHHIVDHEKPSVCVEMPLIKIDI